MLPASDIPSNREVHPSIRRSQKSRSLEGQPHVATLASSQAHPPEPDVRPRWSSDETHSCTAGWPRKPPQSAWGV